MPLVEHDMRDLMRPWVDEQPLDATDRTIGGVNSVSAAHLHLPRGNAIGDQDAGALGDAHVTGPGPLASRPAETETEVGQRHHLFGWVRPVVAWPVNQFELLRVVKRAKLRRGAEQADRLLTRLRNKIDRHEMACPVSMSRLDDQVRDHPCVRVNDDALELSTRAVAADDVASDHELHDVTHFCTFLTCALSSGHAIGTRGSSSSARELPSTFSRRLSSSRMRCVVLMTVSGLRLIESIPSSTRYSAMSG